MSGTIVTSIRLSPELMEKLKIASTVTHTSQRQILEDALEALEQL